MKRNAFVQYIRGQYWPPNQGNKEEGGYLVPETIMSDKPGLLPKIYRRLGLLFRSKRIYHKGTYEFPLSKHLESLVEHLKREGENDE